MSYAFMKILETAPTRYDRGMRLLTLGRLDRVYEEIQSRLHPDDCVLDVGCGTGRLAILLARKGIKVTGIDLAAPMLRVARQRIGERCLENQVTVRQLGIVDLGTAFPDGSFDAAVATLVFSELSDDEIEYGLEQIARVLRPGGKLFVADEVLPESLVGRFLTALSRFPFVLLSLLLTQNRTRRTGRLRHRIEAAGFRVVDGKRYLVRTLELSVAERRS